VNRYLVDTNVVSELRKPRPHGGVVAWFRQLQEQQIYLSAVTIGELQAGVERVRRQDAGKAAEIEAWLDQVADSFQVLAMDSATFREWARLMDSKADDLMEDAMIAATARVHQLIVATRNERDFAGLRAKVLNPFKAES